MFGRSCSVTRIGRCMNLERGDNECEEVESGDQQAGGRRACRRGVRSARCGREPRTKWSCCRLPGWVGGDDIRAAASSEIKGPEGPDQQHGSSDAGRRW